MANNHCSNCKFWVGRCLKGRKTVIASSQACELFEPKGSGFSIMTNIPEYNAHNVNNVTNATGCNANNVVCCSKGVNCA
jgi:hypothetical protein